MCLCRYVTRRGYRCVWWEFIYSLCLLSVCIFSSRCCCGCVCQLCVVECQALMSCPPSGVFYVFQVVCAGAGNVKFLYTGKLTTNIMIIAALLLQ